MTALKLSDLAGPDASGFSDVAVFVRADGSESEPFVVLETLGSKACICGPNVTEQWKLGMHHVRRFPKRGRLVPARIEMEGEATKSSSFDAVSRLTVWLREYGKDKTQVWRDDLAEVLRMAAMVLPIGEATADLATHVRLLRAALEPFATHAVPCAGQPCPWCDARLAMMATEERP